MFFLYERLLAIVYVKCEAIPGRSKRVIFVYFMVQFLLPVKYSILLSYQCSWKIIRRWEWRWIYFIVSSFWSRKHFGYVSHNRSCSKVSGIDATSVAFVHSRMVHATLDTIKREVIWSLDLSLFFPFWKFYTVRIITHDNRSFLIVSSYIT